MKICINGQIFDLGKARIDPRDRGLTLGDGLYETISIKRGNPRRLEMHLSRLRDGAAVLNILLLNSDTQIEDMIMSTLKENNVIEGVVRLTLTRGPGERGLMPPKITTPTLMISAIASSPSTGAVNVILSKKTRRNEHSPLSAIKSTNTLDNFIARAEAQASGANDALLLNTANHLAEGTTANVFLLVDGGLITPPISDGALPGIMRGEVIRLARAEERTVNTNTLMRASEIFMTSALGLRPVASVDGQLVGDGKAGLITQMLAARL